MSDEPRPTRPAPGAADAPWAPLPDLHDIDGVLCNICRWRGESFVDGGHVELLRCPSCGSNGRDRFFRWCLTRRVAPSPGWRVLECSPRRDLAHRSAVGSGLPAGTSGYDMPAHDGNLQFDLQAIALPDACLDVVLCDHLLEHVPHTDKALRELRRVIAPGGHLLLQAPVLQGRTAPQSRPEFHDGRTPVIWRFGFDLTKRLRSARFATTVLCAGELLDAVRSGENPRTDGRSRELDVPGMLAGAVAGDLEAVADADQARRLGLDPGYMYVAWHCRVPV